MCTICGSTPCSCNNYYPSVVYPTCYPAYQPPSCSDTSMSPCPLQLDSQCVFYHKFNSELSQLTNLNISNGASIESIFTAIDPYIGQLKFGNFTLTYLRQSHVVNNLQQFAESVDNELSLIHSSIEELSAPAAMGRWLGNLSSDPGAAVDGDYWWNTTSSSLKIKVNNGVVKTITTS